MSSPNRTPKSYIVDAALHSAVHCLGVIVVVVLWSGRMKLQIAFFVVGLLEQNVGSDAGFFQQAVIVHRGCGNIDVNAADRAVFMLDAVNGVDANPDNIPSDCEPDLLRLPAQDVCVPYPARQ